MPFLITPGFYFRKSAFPEDAEKQSLPWPRRKHRKELGKKAKAFVEDYFNIQDFERDMKQFLKGKR